MKIPRKLFLLLFLAFIGTGFLFAEDAAAENTELTQEKYVEITSQDEWFLNREIKEYTYSGVNDSHKAAVEKIFSRYIGKKFTYDILSALQTKLYNLGYFQNIDPQVDLTDDLKLNLMFDFEEMPIIKQITFISSSADKELEINSDTLLQQIDIKTEDAKTNEEIQYSAQDLIDYYKSIGRDGTKVEAKIIDTDDDTAKNIEYIITEADEKKIDKITFVKNTQISSRELSKKLKSKTAGSYRDGYLISENIAEDIQNIESYYKNQGYIDAVVELDKIIVLNQDNPTTHKKVEVIYKVTEGEIWKVGDITCTAQLFDVKTLLSGTKLKKGKFFNADLFEKDKASILNHYYNAGYIFANINASTKRTANNTINIDYQILEGSKAYIEKVEFTGLKKTHDYVFRRELAIKDGEPFSRDKLQQSYLNIYNTGLVQELNYELKQGSKEENLIMCFDIKEAQSMDVTFGLTFGGNDGGFPLSFLTTLNNKNLSGTGRTLSIGAQVTTDYQSLNFSFGSNWFKNTRWSNLFSFSFERNIKDNVLQQNPYSEQQVGRNRAYPWGYNSYDDYEAYDEALPSLEYLMKYEMYRVSMGYNTGYTWVFTGKGRLSTSFGLSLGLNHVIYNKDQYIPFEYLITQYNEGWKFSNRATIGFSWDGRDYVEDTQKGYIISENITYSGGILGGLSNYIKTTTSASGYLTLLKINEKKVKQKALVGSLTTTVSMMLPQFWDSGNMDKGKSGLGWHDPKYGATRSEMLYIDGMRWARGHSTVYDISFMWDNMLEISYPVVKGIVNAEVFTSMTGASKTLDNVAKNLIWYGAFGAGFKLKIQGFPLGIYFVGDYTLKDGSVTWKEDGLFNYVHPVLAISTSLI